MRRTKRWWAGATARAAAWAPAAVAVLVVSAGCRGDDVTHYSVPKVGGSSPVAAGPGLGGAQASPATMPPGMAGDVPMPPAPTGSSALRWRLPKGWTQQLTGGMRYATLTPPVSGRIDASVVVLPGPAGGELANVNRWRGQIGLPPVDEGALPGLRKTIRSQAGEVLAYDFESEGTKRTRTLAGLLERDGRTWFVKMTGDAEAVDAARKDFLGLMESLHFE